MELNLKGKRVLITGASQGIGEGLALAFAREGCEVRLVARSTGKLLALAERAKAACGVRADILAVDMASPGAITQVAHSATASTSSSITRAAFLAATCGTSTRRNGVPVGS